MSLAELSNQLNTAAAAAPGPPTAASDEDESPEERKRPPGMRQWIPSATRVEAEHPDGYSWRETDDELEVRVPAAFRELEILDVPSCRPEPAQIVSALNRIRDAELLAFIEMGTAEAGGSSRETALRELDIQMPIVERELDRVDTLLGAIK